MKRERESEREIENGRERVRKRAIHRYHRSKSRVQQKVTNILFKIDKLVAV